MSTISSRLAARGDEKRRMAKKSGLTQQRGMEAPAVIGELVEKFAEHRETYRRAGYNETQLRQDFLDPFFIALGWDVYNRAGIRRYRRVDSDCGRYLIDWGRL